MKFRKFLISILCFMGIYTNQAISETHQVKFGTQCEIVYKQKTNNIILSKLSFIVKSERGTYLEMLSCAGACASERIYLDTTGFIISIHKYSGDIINKNIKDGMLTILYEGSDRDHKRKIQLNSKTGELRIFEFGKTILSSKEFHEESTSKCDNTKFTLLK